MFYAVPAMEPILTSQDSSAQREACPAPTSSSASSSLQLVATIGAWEAECSCGWFEPEPIACQGELALPPVYESAVIGSAWDSWSTHPYLEHQQVEELPGFDVAHDCGS